MKKHWLKYGALSAAAALALAGCSAQASDTDSKGDIKIGVFNGWDDTLATSVLWEAILDEKGYDASLEYADLAPALTGVASGEYDFTTGVWLPHSHGSFIEPHADDIEDLGVWNDQDISALTVAVNEDAPIDSLDELAEHADEFDNKIVGIEPGGGTTNIMADLVIPAYGLESMDFINSSTAAMLAELEAATTSGDNVVVTLWQPHWAHAQFPVKVLEDPKGVIPGGEEIHVMAHNEFREEQPEVATWLSDFEMDLDTLYDLQEALFINNESDDYDQAIAQWIEQNREYVDSLTS